MDDRAFWLEIRRALLTGLRAIDNRLGIHSRYTVERQAPGAEKPPRPVESRAS